MRNTTANPDLPTQRIGLALRRAAILLRLLLVGLVVSLMSATAIAAPEPKPADDEKPAAKPKDSDAKPDEDKDKKDEKKEEPEPDRFFAIKGATVHTVTDGVRDGITILVKNGKIHEMGFDVVIPDETEVLDAAGYHVYPGLVAVSSGGILGSEPPNDSTNVYSLNMTVALAGGITTAVTGNTAAKLTFGSVEDMLVRQKIFTTLKYSTRNASARQTLRAAFEKVRQYLRDVEVYEEKKKTDPDAKEPKKDWIKGQHKTCLSLIKHETVAVVSADSAHDILDICDLARRYGFRLVIRGATEGWTVASQMARAGASAIITPRNDRASDERLNRKSGASIENAAILYNHGIPLAIIPRTTGITLWGLAGRDLLHLNMEAAFAVRGGLPEDAALRAITIDAARMLGIDHRVGSIEIGKDADFAITDGDILHYMTHTRWAVVNGRLVYDKMKDTLFSHIRPNGDLDAPPPDDHWPRKLGADQ